MMKITFFATLLALCTLLSCSDPLSDASKKLAEELETSYTHDGKQIEMVGYLYPSNVSMISNDLVDVWLYSSWSKTNALTHYVQLHFGTGANSISMPKKFKTEDVELYDNTGTRIKCSDKVKITGTVVYTAKGPKAPESDLAKSIKANMVKTEAQKKKEEEEKKKDDGNDYSYKIKDVVITKL